MADVVLVDHTPLRSCLLVHNCRRNPLWNLEAAPGQNPPGAQWLEHPTPTDIYSVQTLEDLSTHRERERKREREWECRRTDRQWARNTSQQEPNGSHMYSWPPYRFHLASARTLRSQPAKHSTYTAAAAATRLGITPHDLTGLHHKKHSHKQHSLPAFPRFAWGAP